MYVRLVLVALSLILSTGCSDTASSDPGGPAPLGDGGAKPSTGEGETGVLDSGQVPATGASFTIQPDSLAIDFVGGPSGQSSSYAAHPDAEAPESGKPSMLLASTVGATPKTFAATTGNHQIDGGVVGRRYRMRGKIKTENATKAWLWFRIDGPGFFVLDNMAYPVDRRIGGTTDWQEIALILDVPAKATNFAFGSGLMGEGKVWVGALTFEEVGPEVATTPHFGQVP